MNKLKEIKYKKACTFPAGVIRERYRMIKCISSRKFSNVYIALDFNRSRKVVIKELLIEALDSKYRDEALVKFIGEIESYKRVNHKNMAQIIDCFSVSSTIPEENKYFIIMDYVKGKTLRAIKEKSGEKISFDTMLLWINQISEALIYLYEEIPRNFFYYLSPDHIMIDEKGDVKLINFGLGRFFRKGPFKCNQYMGVPGYSAPEQYGIREIDERADMFSLGTIIYYMLTGDDPKNHPLRFCPVSKFNPTVPHRFEKFISTCLQIKPYERFMDFKHFISEFYCASSLEPDVYYGKNGKKKITLKYRLSFFKEIVGKFIIGRKESIRRILSRSSSAHYLYYLIILFVIFCLHYYI